MTRPLKSQLGSAIDRTMKYNQIENGVYKGREISADDIRRMASFGAKTVAKRDLIINYSVDDERKVVVSFSAVSKTGKVVGRDSEIFMQEIKEFMDDVIADYINDGYAFVTYVDDMSGSWLKRWAKDNGFVFSYMNDFVTVGDFEMQLVKVTL